MLSTSIKLSFSIKTLVLSILSGGLRQVLLYLFCFSDVIYFVLSALTAYLVLFFIYMFTLLVFMITFGMIVWYLA